MNKRGAEKLVFGALIMVFITVIVGLVLLSPTASNVASSTETQVVSNATATPTKGVIADLEGRAVVTDTFIATNASDGQVLDSGNYTITDNQLNSAGELTAQINFSGEYAGAGVNYSYGFEPSTYISNAGGRSLASLIIIFFALAIGVIALYPTLKNSF